MRQNACWITSFREYGRSWFTSDLWLEWGAIWILGLCAARQVFFELNAAKKLYTNMYLMPVGEPGTGKGEAIEAMRSVLTPLGRFVFAPNSSTRAAMLDYMKENLSARQVSGRIIASHEMVALNEELGSLIPENDNWYLTTLNELFDCRDRYESRTRTHGVLELTEVFSHLFAGAQPQYLSMTFPEQAWGMGFMSRTIMIYEGEQQKRIDLFATQSGSADKRRALTADLEQITDLYGRVEFDNAAKAAIQAWYNHDMEPKPTHPKLKTYATRRIMNLYKIAMISSLSRGNSLTVTADDVFYAKDLLLRTEERMPQIFLEMGGNVMSSAVQDIAIILRAFFTKTQKPLPEASLVRQISLRVPPNQVLATLNTMIAAGMVKVTGPSTPGMRSFLPGAISDGVAEVIGRQRS